MCTVIKLLTGRSPYTEIANSMSGEGRVVCGLRDGIVRPAPHWLRTYELGLTDRLVMFRIVEDEGLLEFSKSLQEFLNHAATRTPRSISTPRRCSNTRGPRTTRTPMRSVL